MINKVNIKLIYTIFAFLFLFNIFHYPICSYSGENHLNLEKKSGLDSIKDLSANKGFISIDDYNFFWFIQISDTQFLWYDENKIASFYKFLNKTYKEIDPLFIYHTGDIVDAHFGLQQDKIEWELYKKALDDNKMNASIYMDIIGNHDAVQDPNFNYFLNYSMMGRSFNTTQYSFNRTFNFGNYAFIGLNTAKESYNLFEFGYQGFLNSEELNWYETELEKYKEFDKIFVFGHHPPSYPPYYSIQSEVSLSGKDFYELNEEYNVSYYLSGHIHDNAIQYLDKLLTISTLNFDQNNGQYRIIALDNNRLSTSIETVGVWPQAIITNPSEENNLIRNLNDNEEKVRVLAWDPEGIESVAWSLFEIEGEHQITAWKPLERKFVDEPLWEGYLDVEFHGRLMLKIQIEGHSGTTFKTLIYFSKADINIISLSITIIMTIALISISLFIIFNVYNEMNRRKK